MFGVLVFCAIFTTLSGVPAVFALKVGNCALPPYPENGHYIVEGNSTAKPGDILDSYVLKVTCHPGYHSEFDNPNCLQGLFSNLPKCIQCGTILNAFSRDVAGGQTAKLGDMPWHAGVYSKLFKPYKQICGGSLVSSTIIISAGHCFWDDVKKQLPAENYAVAIGKIYRPWNDPHDEMAQKSDVQEIKIPPRFQGSANNFQEDLALVVLRNPVSFTSAVRPICLNFDYDFDNTQLANGSLGKVGGWGLKAEDGPASPILQYAILPSIDIEQCIADSEPYFLNFISCDKFCAGYSNGTAVCKGDSGGGLAFPETTQKGTKFYLRGVVSAAPKTEHLCSVYHWAIFTQVQRHKHFIEPLMNRKLGPQ